MSRPDVCSDMSLLAPRLIKEVGVNTASVPGRVLISCCTGGIFRVGIAVVRCASLFRQTRENKLRHPCTTYGENYVFETSKRTLVKWFRVYIHAYIAFFNPRF